ncbi:MAG: glycerophosphodiester phosphodiesterase family protein, partial [Phycisphaerae bacterium]
MEASTIFAVAHRGASNEYPENTVAAFDRAIELGAPAVEFDVRMAADGVPVIFHDAEISRTTSGQGLLQDWTSHDLMRLDAGTWKHPRFAGVRIPTLGEALACIAERARPVLELKVP